MFYLLFFIIKLIFRIPLFKIILLLVMAGIYLPYHVAQAQFYDNSKPLLEASAHITVGSYYVHAIPRFIPGYTLKGEYGYVFYYGQPPFNFSTGLFIEEPGAYDPRLASRFSIFYNNTSGRAIDRDSSLAQIVDAENYGVISYRQRLWKNLLSAEVETAQEFGTQGHGGLKASFGARFRFLTFERTKFYIGRFIYYGDQTYIEEFFDTRSTLTNVDNIALRGGLYETQDRLTITSDLGHHIFFEVDFRRGKLLNTAKYSYASLTDTDNNFYGALGYRY